MSQTTGRRRSKRLAAYDEEDGDFVFTRGTKRTKTTASEPEAVSTTAPAAKRGRKLKEPPKDRDNVGALNPKQKKGKDMRVSTPNSIKESITVPRKRKTSRSSIGKSQDGETSANASRLDATDVVRDATPETNDSTRNSNKHSTFIPLPFSDTPVINRNKELRKKAGNSVRRSSLGLRGRRASSLIDNGHSAIPHCEVEMSDFYKYIEADGLTEPRRMKQLLTWIGERCIGSKPSHGDPDSAAELAEARHVKEALLKDFGNKSEFSYWFNREEPVPAKVIIKKPNPRNVELEENVEAVEARIKLLREERDQWKVLAKPPPSLPLIFPKDNTEFDLSQINASLLEPEQAAFLVQVSSSSALELRDQASRRLQALQSELEFKVDQFADGVHKMEQYHETVGRVADKILALSSFRLEERDRKLRAELGTRDLPIQEVLRSLSRILPEGSNRR